MGVQNLILRTSRPLGIGTGLRVLMMRVWALIFPWRSLFDHIRQFASIIVSIAILANPFAHVRRELQSAKLRPSK
jgi:hypothetical protein